MEGSHFLAFIANWLLGHTKVHQVGIEFFEILFKTDLLGKGVVIKVSNTNREICIARFPEVFIFGANENRVLVYSIDLLQIGDEAFDVAAGGRVDDTGVDGDMGHVFSI